MELVAGEAQAVLVVIGTDDAGALRDTQRFGAYLSLSGGMDPTWLDLFAEAARAATERDIPTDFIDARIELGASESAPADGAELSIDGQPGVVGPIKLPRGTEPVVLTFKADGYYPMSKSVIPDRDQPLPILLKKKPVVVRPSPGVTTGKKVPSKDDLATPNFGK